MSQKTIYRVIFGGLFIFAAFFIANLSTSINQKSELIKVAPFLQRSENADISTEDLGDSRLPKMMITGSLPPPPPPPDVTPPIISSINVLDVGTSTAEITWSTNEMSDGEISYGTTSEYGLSSFLDSSMTVSHSILLSLLSTSTTYHFEIISKDQHGNLGISTDLTFQTADLPPPPPPHAVILSIAVSDILPSSAEITWQTDLDTDSEVLYGTTTDYGLSSGVDGAMETSHSVSLSSLNPATFYHFVVRSKDSNGDTVTSEDMTFLTPPLPDIEAPVISSLNVSSIATSSAVVNWTTDEMSNSQVEYGTEVDYDISSVIDSSMSESHQVNLSNLSPNTTYHYRVNSRDEAGNLAVSDYQTFVTPPLPDVTPPVILNIESDNVGTNSADIYWTTDEVGDSQVEYGTSSDYGLVSDLDSAMVLSHFISLSNLSPSTTYHYRVNSRDGSGNLATSTDQTFVTADLPPPLDITPPQISNIESSNMGTSTATINWITDEMSDSQVEYGTGDGYGLISNLDDSMTTSHSVSLRDLLPNTLYHFRVDSTDESGNLGTSSDQTFQTASLPDVTPPSISAINVSNIGTNSAEIDWSTDEMSDTQVFYGLNSSYDQQSLLDSTLATSHSISLSSLTAGSTYHFQVRSRDASGNLASSDDQTFVTENPPPAVISSVAISDILPTSANITWQTDLNTDSEVIYGTTNDYELPSVIDGTMETSHLISLSSLYPSTTYHFAVRSKNSYGDSTTSDDMTFLTPPLPDVTAPVISNILSSSIGTSTASIIWTTDEISNTQVEYGTSIAYSISSDLDSTMTLSHEVNLSNLLPSTIYHFRVNSKDEAGNLSVGDDQTFETAPLPDITAPIISSILSSDLSTSTASVSWNTNELSDSQIFYGLNSSYDRQTLLDSTFTISHSVSLSSLTSNSTYHFQIQSKDASQNLATSSDQIFQTAPLPPPPPLPLGLYTPGATVTAGCPSGFACNQFTVSCPGISENIFGVIADQKASTSTATKGVVIFFSGIAGTEWWSQEGNSSSTPNISPSTLQSLKNQGYELVQIQWNNGWTMAPQGVSSGQVALACRPATAIKWVHDNLYSPLGITPTAVGKCGFCITGNSAGASQVAYSISNYGLDSIVNAAIPSSGPPMANISKGCLQQPGYAYDAGKAKLIDQSYGFGGNNPNGPCLNHMASSTIWIANSNETGGIKYNYPTTRVNIIVGALDQDIIKNRANDYYQKLLQSGQSMVTLQTVPHMLHGIQADSFGLTALFNSITQ